MKEIIGEKVDYSEIEAYSEEIATKLFQHLKANHREETPQNIFGDNESDTEETPQNIVGGNESADSEFSNQRTQL